MRTCNNCGSDVTLTFARVFGANDDEVYACPECTTMTEILQTGAAAARPSPAGGPVGQ
jgi:protein-arginine kinase activator protein McsA